MRIVSLWPAATEIVCALGLEDQLIAVSASCNWPPEILGRPVVTRPVRRGASPWTAELDAAALVAAQADLVIAGRPSELRTPARRGIAQLIRDIDPDPSVLVLEPLSVEGIFNAIVSVGAMTEAEDEAIGLVELLREDLQDIEERQAERRAEGVVPARVVTLERLEPPVAAGLWIPELVRRAGGWEVLGQEGEPARETTWEAIADVDPEVLIALDGDSRTSDILYPDDPSTRPPEWTALAAVEREHAYAVDGVYLSRPGPRFVDGLAIFAEILDPDGFTDAAPAGSWTPVFAFPP